MSLTKSDLINKLNEQTDLSKKDCSSAVEATFNIIKAELEDGTDVKISRFGRWSVKAQKERIGRNPKTGKSVTIIARKIVTFKPSLIMHGILNR